MARRLFVGNQSKDKVYAYYKSRAKRKNIEFKISKAEFFKLMSKNCYYCGTEPNKKYQAKDKRNKTQSYFIYNGIDRINSNKGYRKFNILPSCYACNVAKNSLTKRQFFALIRKIHKIHG